jgi:hypothetical protein
MVKTRSGGSTAQAESQQDPVEANARFTGILGLVLFVLLMIEIATFLLGVRSLLDLHVVAGFMVLALVIPKLMTTGYRLTQYYSHQPAFASEGPPPTFLRILSPVMAVAGIGLLASGILLLFGPSSLHNGARHVHNFTFYLFLVLIVVHTAAHLKQSLDHSAADLRGATLVAGRRLRFATVVGALAAGAVVGNIAANQVSSYLTTWPHQ